MTIDKPSQSNEAPNKHIGEINEAPNEPDIWSIILEVTPIVGNILKFNISIPRGYDESTFNELIESIDGEHIRSSADNYLSVAENRLMSIEQLSSQQWTFFAGWYSGVLHICDPTKMLNIYKIPKLRDVMELIEKVLFQGAIDIYKNGGNQNDILEHVKNCLQFMGPLGESISEILKGNNNPSK